jgi:hypothetical protein
MFGDFLKLGFYSLLLGFIFGFISSLIFKWFRFISHSAITETLIIFIIGFLSYFIAEIY